MICIKASRIQLYRAKRKAMEEIEGNHSRSYSQLLAYAAEVMRSNPGSVVIIEREPRNSTEVMKNPKKCNPMFKRIFVAFEARQTGFISGCRPFIGMDGCHLKGPFGGVLLAAIA